MMSTLMPFRVLLPQTLGVLAALVLALVASAQDASGRRSASDQAREILESGGYQRELPGAWRSRPANSDRPAPERSSDRQGTGSRAERRPREENVPSSGRTRRGEASAAQGDAAAASSEAIARVLWILVIVLLAVLLIVGIVAAFANGRAPKLQKLDSIAAQGLTPAVPFDPGPRPLSEAERLASEGRYSEAIHILLQRTFEALRDHSGLVIAPWMTSRELQRRASIGEDARVALAALVDAVERSLFGVHEAGRDDYERCTAAYRALQSQGAQDAQRAHGAAQGRRA
jgi:flagellar basal body-associated protein FliL